MPATALMKRKRSGEGSVDNVPMPNQGPTDAEVIAIIEYLKNPEKVK